MIRELKKRMDKFGVIIAPYSQDENTQEDIDALKKLSDVSAYVYLHGLTPNPTPFATSTYGLVQVQHKNRPSFQQMVGHYLTQFSPAGLVAFIKPTTRILTNAEKVYEFVDNNRMERTFGFYTGDIDDPTMIGVSGSLVEHIFHGLPGSAPLDADWLKRLSQWIRMSLLGGRYFDANSLLGIATIESIFTEPEHAKVIDEGVADSFKAFVSEVINEQPVPVERKPGRPKKKA